MNSFEQREKEEADERYAHMLRCAESENDRYNDAVEPAAELEKYLHQKSLQVGLSRIDNKITLTRRDGHTLVVSTRGNKTYGITRSGFIDWLLTSNNPPLKERGMMDEVLTWLRSC